MTRFEVERVSAGYGARQVLFDVTLPALGGGDVLGLLGPNASGKSTLLRCLSREMRAEGRITMNGVPQREFDHARWHEQVATMPQTPPSPSALLPVELMWSKARAMSLALSDRALAARIDELFALLGLEGVALSPLHTLSGGKRQLVGLALALIREPAILLLDEPTSALDLHWRMVVLELVRERVAARGGVVIAAMHDLDLAARYCERIAILDGGRVAAAGSPESVLTPTTLARVYKVEAHVAPGSEGRLTIDVLRPLRDG